MSDFYVNSIGSNTAPYDTPAKGALKLSTVVGLENNGDTIYIVNNGDTIDDRGVIINFNIPNVTLRSTGNASDIKAKILLGAPAGDFAIGINSVAFNFNVHDIEFYYDAVNYTTISTRIILSSAIPLSIQRCMFDSWTKSSNLYYGAVQFDDVDDDCIFINNIIANSNRFGLKLGSLGGLTGINNKIFNNTFYNTGLEGAIHFSQVDLPNTAKIRNNAIYSLSYDGMQAIGTDSITDSNYNCIYTPSGNNYTGVISPGINDLLNTNPLYNNPNSSDFAPNNSSPCKGAGIGNAADSDIPTIDYFGASRIGGLVTDIGAINALPYTPTNVFSDTPAIGATGVISTVDPAILLGYVTGDSYFKITSDIARVDIFYTHTGGRQRKRINHKGQGLTGIAQWSIYGQSGDWLKSRIIMNGHDGEKRILNRNETGITGEDLLL